MKKAHLKRLTILLFVLPVLLLSSCTERLPEWDDIAASTYERKVVGNTTAPVICWGNFVISEIGTGAVYDRTTGDMVLGVCDDPECDLTCPLHWGGVELAQASDGKVYFIFKQLKEKTYYYCYKELVSGRVEVMFKVSFDDATPNKTLFVIDGQCYYTRKYLKEEGNPNDPEDYVSYVCRIPEAGGANEILYEMRDNSETLYLIADGMMITSYQGIVYRIDIDTKEVTPFLDLEEEGIPSFGQPQYLDGKMYFFTNSKDWMTTTPKGSPVNQPRIAMADVITGEWKYLIDHPVVSYHITNDAIYFSPVEIQMMSDPTKYQKTDVDASFLLASSTLYACDLDGGNIRKVWTEETHQIDFIENYTVVDGVLYGWLFNFNQKTNEWGERYFAEIHFDTNEIIPAASVVDRRK